MKKNLMIGLLLVIVFAGSVAVACPLPVDVKIQKVTIDNKNLVPVADVALATRLRSQLREAFSCGKKQQNNIKSKDVINVELVEIIHAGTTSTRVNIATDRGFFSAKAARGLSGLSSREQFEEAMKWIVKDIESVCEK